MVEFLDKRTNCSVIQQPNAEADDLIATWIQQHPEDNHVIISTDSDFYQLLAPNVTQYNGTTDQIVSLEGFKNAKTGEWVVDKKTNEVKTPVIPEWVLFEKCVRGDSSDNVFSAYPGARLKGTKNKTGITEAYEDRHTGGYNYNNFMLQRWVDHEEEEHRVKDDFERNKILIDLTMQPDEVKAECKARIDEAKEQEPKQQVGIYFMKFCAKWNLERMSQNPGDYAEFMNGKA
jgi:5'-3' exonuclease